MKKILITALLCLSLAVPADAKVIKAPKGFYPHMGVVTKCKKVKNHDYFRVTFRDAVGRKWSWYDDNSDTWQKGDFVAVIMYDNGTETIYDDAVVDARYVGYKALF